VFNDASGSRLPATLGQRYSGGDVDMQTICRKFIQVSVIAMLHGDIGHKTGGTLARLRQHTLSCVKVICAASFCVGWSQSSSMPFCTNTAICKLHVHPLWEIS